MQNLKVLVVDDDEDFAESLALVLEDEGHTVQCVETIEQTVSEYRDSSYDLVMIDLRLRGESGVECFERLRDLDEGVRAVVMTGYSADDVIQRALSAGARQVLRKPFGEHELIAALQEAA